MKGNRCGNISVMTPLPRLSWKWRRRSSVKIAERTYAKRAQALHGGGEGGDSTAPSFRQGSGFRSVRGTGIATHGVLPLAERVLRERGSRLPNERTSSPPSGGEAETD